MVATFPGAQHFGPGKSNKFVTLLGVMLIKRGGARFYKSGAGPTWSDADRNATRAFQRAQGWVGDDADGFPGATTWEYLAKGKGKDIPPAKTSTSGKSQAPSKIKSPVPGHPEGYPYGVKNSGYKAGFHTGQDYRAPKGAKLVAVRDGKIGKVGHDQGGYGKHIVLQADNGRDYWYCHLSVVSVSKGKSVDAGDKVGEVGSTGNSTGPHLHFEDRPRDGKYGNVRRPSW